MKIAFGYKMRVGKDTAATYLHKKIGGKQISFASPIYDILYYAQTRCGFPTYKDRQFLQYVGTEWARNKDPDVWINIALKEAKNEENAFISDLRFPNEFETLKKNGWICVKIIRNYSEDFEGVGNGSHIHTSETALDGLLNEHWDYILYNNSTLDNFYTQLDKLVDNIINDK